MKSSCEKRLFSFIPQRITKGYNENQQTILTRWDPQLQGWPETRDPLDLLPRWASHNPESGDKT